MLQEIVLPVCGARFDLADLFADRDERIAEPIELRFGLALGRLHHQRPRDGEGDGGWVEAVIDQPLRDVLDLHAR